MTLAAGAGAASQLSLKTGKTAAGFQLAQGGEGGEGGEQGTGGSGDADFLTLLGLVEGHLRAGMELYRQGAADMAKTHMKHPSDELYVDLEPALVSRKREGFAPSLESLAHAIETGRPVDEAQKAFDAALADIDRARAASTELGDRLESITNLVRKAADEYGEGVKDGKIIELHEYQDAWGFTQAAKAQLASLSSEDRTRMGKSFDEIARELDGLDSAWPAFIAPTSITADASVLYGAAARIEIAALAVK